MGARLVALEARRTAMSGRLPETLATGNIQRAIGRQSPSPIHRHTEPIHGFTDLKPIHVDVLELLRIKPRNTREIAEALNVEWSLACHAADGLVNRSLAEEVRDADVRPSWRAT